MGKNVKTLNIGNNQYDLRPLGNCQTEKGTAAKVVVCPDFVLYTGATITVAFLNENTVTKPTLNVNNTGAKYIYFNGTFLPSTQYWGNNTVVEFVYGGEAWHVIGLIKDNNTTYSAISDDDLTILLNTYLPYGDPSGAGISEALLDETEE